MGWKNLTIGKKITVGYGVILILLSVVGVLNYVGVGTLVNNAAEVIDGNKLTSMLVQREVDHLKWAGKVNALLTDDSITELQVQTDDHKCGMGKWLYGPERKEAEKLVPSLVPILKSLEEPHRKLHESAIDIDLAFEQGDVSLPIRITEIEAHLAWANRAYEALINQEKSVKKFQTDPTKCMLGKFMSSEQGQAAYKNGSAEFKELWDSIHPSHIAMHTAGKSIQKFLSEEKFDDASKILQEEVMGNSAAKTRRWQYAVIAANILALGLACFFPWWWAPEPENPGLSNLPMDPVLAIEALIKSFTANVYHGSEQYLLLIGKAILVIIIGWIGLIIGLIWQKKQLVRAYLLLWINGIALIGGSAAFLVGINGL